VDIKLEEFKELSKKALAQYFLGFLEKDDSKYIIGPSN